MGVLQHAAALLITGPGNKLELVLLPLSSTGDYLGAGVGLKLESILLPELRRGWDWRLPRLHRCRRSRCTAGAGAPLLLGSACRCRPPGNPPLPQHSADSSVLERPCCIPLLFPGVASSSPVASACISKKTGRKNPPYAQTRPPPHRCFASL